MARLTRDFKQKDAWRAALRGCPRWMYRAVWGIFLYCWAGFFVLPLLYGGGMDEASNKARSMSAGLLIFYLIPLAAASGHTGESISPSDTPTILGKRRRYTHSREHIPCGLW
jgi:hypothetical protein